MITLYQPDPDPEPIKEILSRLFVVRGLTRRQGRLQLEKAWEKAVGEYRDHTKVLALRRGILEVEVNGAIVLQELASYHKRRLLKSLQESLPSTAIKEIRFRASSW